MRPPPFAYTKCRTFRTRRGVFAYRNVPGTTQLSPALQRWEQCRPDTQVPKGRPARDGREMRISPRPGNLRTALRGASARTPAPDHFSCTFKKATRRLPETR